MKTDQATYTAISNTVLIEHALSTQEYRDKCAFSVNRNVLNMFKEKTPAYVRWLGESTRKYTFRV